ncbi:MAG: type II toxin-antitoxin system Phd/YefM family antitoxin [Chloroflexota bacterium]
MRTASITETKNQLSALIDRVRAGESVLILDRGVPVARLEPVAGDDDPTGRLQRLERAGLIRAGGGEPPIDLLREPMPKLPPGVSAVEALLEERNTGW